MLGIAPEVRTGLFSGQIEGISRAGIGETAAIGFMRIGFFIRTTVLGLIRLVTAGLGMDQLAGPIGIVNIIGGEYQATVEAAAEAGAGMILTVLSVILSMANFTALISANLGVINLLPLPALDGGRLVFLTLEAIRRKPVPPEREGMVHLAGFVLLMILAVFIAYQDILNLL
jgi:regulator of sigma E protease